MRTIEIKHAQGSIAAFLPTRGDVEGLREGSLAPDAFGGLSPITSLTCIREDIAGKLFAHYYTNTNGLNCSMSVKEGRLVRSVRTSNYFTSAQLDTAERIA